MIHAPSVNFTMTKMSTTSDVTVADVGVDRPPRGASGRRFSRRWRATMPAPAKVKPVKTPIA